MGRGGLKIFLKGGSKKGWDYLKMRGGINSLCKLCLFLSFLGSVNNSGILNVLKLFTEQRNNKNRSRLSFSYLALAFPVIFLLFRVFDEFNFHLI